MPHHRPRPLAEVLFKRLKLWPICGVVGIRQSGKSVLLSQILCPRLRGTYVTLDSLRTRKSATQNPEAFVAQAVRPPLIIDEIQKAPDLFDALKMAVDQSRRPGSFIISGSTEFSSKAGIRESLTGRIGISRLFPLTLPELYPKRSFGDYFLKKTTATGACTINEFGKKLELGGMPGICFLRSKREIEESWSGWLETTCFRDLNQILRKDHDGDLALGILHELAKVTEPTATAVAKKLRRDQRIIARYLNAFTSIFVLHRLAPQKSSVGKDHFVFADSGLATYLGAPPEAVLRSHVLVETLAKYEYSGHPPPSAQFFRTSRGHMVPIFLEWHQGANSPKPLAINFFEGEAPDDQDLAPLRNFVTKHEPTARSLLLTHTAKSYFEANVEIHPLRG